LGYNLTAGRGYENDRHHGERLENSARRHSTLPANDSGEYVQDDADGGISRDSVAAHLFEGLCERHFR
jgi:hypothetical protein